MVQRFQKTLADMMVIAISPILIMTLIGSLLFFLLTVLYQGPFETRLTFIFALFVMAIVLIARISIEEGTEYAALFALPLGIVTLLAMMRFVQFQGALGSFRLVTNVCLMSLVWWCAHKLTWDCTLIDERQDSSGEGLLQVTKFDANPDQTAGDSEAEQAATVPSSETTTAERRDASWLDRRADRRRRPHAPGVWIVYFSVAALPIFGIGQTFIPATEPDTRRYAFLLFCVFVASGLGLLLTTSFLGLRRYLRQRNLQMPVDMAAVWLAIGTIMVVGLIGFCTLLPRPGATMAVSQPPFSLESLKNLRPSRFGVGNDGVEPPENASSEPQATAANERSSSSQTSRSPDTSDHQPPNGADDSQPTPAPTHQGSQPQSQQPETSTDSTDQSTQSTDSESPQADSRSSNSPEQSAQSGATRGSDTPRDASNQGQPTESSESTDRSEPSRQQPDTPEELAKQENGSSASESSADESPAKPTPRGSDTPRDASNQGQPTESSESTDRSEPSRQQPDTPEELAKQENGSSASEPSADESPAKSSSEPFNLPEMLSGLTSGFANVLKALLVLVLMVAAMFLLWKYRTALLGGLRQLWMDLQRLLEKLLGGGSDTESHPQEPDQRLTPPGQSFSQFADPFLSGSASQQSTEQLVRYSFEALEAWATERSCGRAAKQTPFEFAQQIGDRHPELGRDTYLLADLYSRIAYGRERISQQRQADLQRLWQQMRTTPPLAPPVRQT